MVARISTVAFQGFRAQIVDVQVQVSAQMPAFTIVGLPDKAVAESRPSGFMGSASAMNPGRRTGAGPIAAVRDRLR